jgi:hypothetical protein
MFSALGVLQFEAELAVNQLWRRWVEAYCKRDPMASELIAHAALTAALVFVTDPDTMGKSPGYLADAGWHVMMEHDTRCLAALYDASLGHYRHHIPDDVVGISKSGKCNSTNDGGGTSKCHCS